MIQTSSENLLELSKVPQHLEKLAGKRPHIASIYRWTKHGIAGIRLETLIIGGTRFTSEQALDRFFQESTKAKEKQNQPKESADSRRRAIEAQADQLGI